MNDTATATPIRCEARTGVTPGEFGFVPTPCGQTRGLRVLVDGQGHNHYFCPAVGHGESVAISNGAIASYLATPTNRQMFEGMDDHDDHDLGERFETSCPACVRAMDRAQMAEA